MGKVVRRIGTVVALSAMMLAASTQAQAQNDAPESGLVLKVNGELVLTNVVARDKNGELVRDLKQSEFRVWESGKEQRLATFDFQSVEMATPLKEAAMSGLATGASGGNAVAVAKPEELRNHRLIVMFFDLTSMQPEDLDRAVAAAKDFLKTKMQSADLVALVSLGDTLKVDQDFTADKTALLYEVGIYNDTEGEGFAAGATSTTNQTEDTTSYTADESEYNDLNTDRELLALRSIAKSLEKIGEKKSLLYFSGGISRDGIENQTSLRAAVNAAVRSNLSIYSVDTRGLQAIGPLGDAATGSLRGSGGMNGGALQNNMDSNFASQEVMATLSKDTGGKAFFDSNDFAPAFAQVQKDTSAYYAVGFHSANGLRDGKYRKLKITVTRPGVKLEYRPGYYAPADFQHAGREDREQQLEEQMASDLPATDMALYMDTFYFRQDQNRYFVPVSLIVPGSQIPFVKGGDKDKATLDIVGGVLDEVKRQIGSVRETVKLNLDAGLNVRQKNVQYTTSFNLPAGKYHLKFVVRENQTGQMGSFEADITLPDLKKAPLKMSSILLANARQPSKKFTPLVRDGQEYVPNISHVFRRDQHLFLLYEVYEPAKSKNAGEQVRVLSSLEMIQNGVKVYETPLVEAQRTNVLGRDAVAIELDVPLDALKPGQYTCQVNVIDDAAGSFAFPRFAVLVREPAKPVAEQPAAGPGK
jgi:VWFA-related protein